MNVLIIIITSKSLTHNLCQCLALSFRTFQFWGREYAHSNETTAWGGKDSPAIGLGLTEGRLSSVASCRLRGGEGAFKEPGGNSETQWVLFLGKETEGLDRI